MKKPKGKILFSVIGILGAAAAIIPLSVYHFIEMAGSDGTMQMICHTACVAATVIGIVITAAAIASMFFGNNKTGAAASALLFAGGIAVYAVPRVFSLCGSVDMACRYLTKPVLTMLGLTIAILSLVLLARQIISIRKEAGAA